MQTLRRIVKSSEDRERGQQMRQTILSATRLSESFRKETVKLSEHVWNFNSFQSSGSPNFSKKHDHLRQPTLIQCQLELFVNHEASPFLAWSNCEELETEDTPSPFKGQPTNTPLGIVWLRGATVRKRGMEVFEVICKENYETKRLLVLTQSEANCEFWVEDIRGAVIGEKQPTPKINFYSLMYGKDSDGEEEDILQKENNFLRLTKRRRTGRKGHTSPSWTRRGSSISTNSSSPSESSCLGGNSPHVERLSTNINTFPPTNINRKSFDASPLLCKLRNYKSSDEIHSSDDTISITSSQQTFQRSRTRMNIETRKSTTSTHSSLSRTPSVGDSYSTTSSSHSNTRILLEGLNIKESKGFLAGEIEAELQNKGIALSAKNSPRVCRPKHLRPVPPPSDRKETVV
ncbi:hypothetical protein LOD99_16210 [Oopsacas minuta]|uniref:PH domain-containing protein n=1 Tax=Oopsacas minuta TaxID=111878 RepID=A0AAV7K6V5_9METZ|nr:hypothetical protein LOD99_16210 [Oopsacas minuta]